MNKHILLAIFAVCSILGTVLIDIYVRKYCYNKDVYNDQFETTNGTITYVNNNPYSCLYQTNCDKCIPGHLFKSCIDMINSNQTGHCYCNKKLCCREVCDYWDDDDYSCKGGYSCDVWNYKPLSSIEEGTCYNPIIRLYFITLKMQYINGTLETKCGPNDVKCLNNFIGNYKAGQQVNIYYMHQNPHKFYLGKYPKFKPSASVLTAIIFGSLFSAIAVAVIIIVIIISINKYRHDRNKYMIIN